MIKSFFGDKKRVADTLLVALLIVISLFAFIIIEATRKEGESVLVRVNGEVVGEYLLSENAEYSLNGGTNILVIKDGAAYIEWADCPRQLCVKERKISRVGERITCLENRVVLEIVGNSEEEILEI